MQEKGMVRQKMQSMPFVRIRILRWDDSSAHGICNAGCDLTRETTQYDQ